MLAVLTWKVRQKLVTSQEMCGLKQPIVLESNEIGSFFFPYIATSMLLYLSGLSFWKCLCCSISGRSAG